MRFASSLFALVLLCLLPAAAVAQPPVEDLPGFVDFTRFGSFDVDDLKIEINLGGALLRLLSSAVEEEDDEFSKLLRSLKQIKVNVFELGEDSAAVSDRIVSTVRELQRQGWESVVSIRAEENIHLLIRADDELILGLLAIWVDPGGSTGMLNIVGDFDPAQIARLARQLDIRPLEALDVGALDRKQDRR